MCGSGNIPHHIRKNSMSCRLLKLKHPNSRNNTNILSSVFVIDYLYPRRQFANNIRPWADKSPKHFKVQIDVIFLACVCLWHSRNRFCYLFIIHLATLHNNENHTTNFKIIFGTSVFIMDDPLIQSIHLFLQNKIVWRFFVVAIWWHITSIRKQLYWTADYRYILPA